MTLVDIITRSLIELNRGTDAQSMEEWRTKLTIFANDAVQELAEHMELRRTETVTAEDGKILVKSLQRPCIKVVDVRQNGGTIAFTQAENSYEVNVSSNGEMEVEYRYAPLEMANDNDEPDIPAYLQRLIVSYVVYREHMTADPTMQRRADPFFQLHEQGKRKARKTLGETDTYTIYNAGW